MTRLSSFFLVCLTIGTTRPLLASDAELLLAGGTLYSLNQRSYKSLRLPNGWHIEAIRYSPDGNALALLLIGVPVSTPSTAIVAPLGPINKIIRAWHPSTRLLIVNRASGLMEQSWGLATLHPVTTWTLDWTQPGELLATAVEKDHPQTNVMFRINPTRRGIPAPKGQTVSVSSSTALPSSVNCPHLLTETRFNGQTLRFTQEKADCSTPPETADVYQLIHPHGGDGKDEILWEERVPANQTACAEPYACYTGADAQFLSLGTRRILLWDGDLFNLKETDDGIDAQLITQLLPQFSHPLGIASGETRLHLLDQEPALPFQPVNDGLRMSHGESPVLYAQNFSHTRSFNAAIEVGDYKQNVMVPAGTQVGPVEIGSFKDRPYTPVLSTLRWTSFHHLADPVYCKAPYTIAPTTSSMVASIREDEKGELHCQIQFQDVSQSTPPDFRR